MLITNRLTAPGGIKRVELYPDTVRVVLSDGTEKVYTNSPSTKITAKIGVTYD